MLQYMWPKPYWPTRQVEDVGVTEVTEQAGENSYVPIPLKNT